MMPKSINSHVSRFLDNYLREENPQYAVLLKGRWGCGKTFFIKEWMKSYSSEPSVKAGDVIRQPLYVSLYGLRSIADINKKMDQLINPFFYSGCGKVINGIIGLASKAVLKTELKLHDQKLEAELDFDALSLFLSKDERIKGNKVIVFDDLERCLIPIVEVLGYINYFVEHCSCHVVLLTDETALEQESKDKFDAFREKTIGREFSVLPDLASFIKSSDNKFIGFIVTNAEFIAQVFQMTGYSNLRTLKQSLSAFQIQYIDRPPASNQENSFYLSLLASFIAVYAEMSKKEHRDLLENWAKKHFQWKHLKSPLPEKEQAEQLKAKYGRLSGCDYLPFDSRIVHHIVDYHLKGVSCREFIESELSDKIPQRNMYSKLRNYLTLENEEFLALHSSLLSSLKRTSQVTDALYGFDLIAYLLLFHVNGIKTLTEEDKTLIVSYFDQALSRATTAEDLEYLRIDILESFERINISFTGTEFEEMISGWLKAVSNKSIHCLNTMELMLENLDATNIRELVLMKDMALTDQSSAYHMGAIFENLNMEKCMASLAKLSNEQRVEFQHFISDHYSCSYAPITEEEFLKDIPALEKLLDFVTGKADETVLIERASYLSLAQTISAIISEKNRIQQ